MFFNDDESLNAISYGFCEVSRRTTKKVTKQRGREQDGGDQIRERKEKKNKEEKRERKKRERDIKHNEKDTFTPPFNGENGEMGNGFLTKSTLGGLSKNFQIMSKIC